MTKTPFLIAVIASSLTAILVISMLFAPKPQNAMNQVLTKKEEAYALIVDGKEVFVTVARTQEEKAKGLMGVALLEGNSGMLFILDQNSQPPFWMKNMLISIDIIWINDNKVSQIHENLVPLKDGENPKFYIPNDSADYVLEVNAGWAKENGIEVGAFIDLSKIL